MCLVEPNVTGGNQAKQQTGGVRAALLLRGLVVSFAVLVPPLVAYALLKPGVTVLESTSILEKGPTRRQVRGLLRFPLAGKIYRTGSATSRNSRACATGSRPVNPVAAADIDALLWHFGHQFREVGAA